MKVSRIFLYDEPAVPEIRAAKLCRFLEEKFSARVEKRDCIFKDITHDTAKDLASIKVFRPREPFARHEPSIKEIEFERDHTVQNVTYYDGYEMQRIVSGIIPESEHILENFHVAFTSRLTCTYDSDGRYHGRALIGSNPSIISTTGIIEAPAKPREYYAQLVSSMVKGLNVDAVRKRYAGTSLKYHDGRLSDVIEGYLLQALFYYNTGEAFCQSRDCRLYNAHWQKDLIHSQLESGELCERHRILK